SLFDNPHVAAALSHPYRPDVDLAVGSDHGHLIYALKLRHRFLWHQQGLRPDVADEADAAILPGTKHIIGIREEASQPDRSGLHVDLTIDREELSPPGEGRSIGSDQLQLEFLLRTLSCCR